MRYLICFFILVFYSLPLFGESIPKELISLGFSEKDLINYFPGEDQEVFTFLDQRTENPQDIVIFTVKDGEITEVKPDDLVSDYTEQFKQSSEEIRKALDDFREELLKEVEPASYSDIMGK